MKKRQKRLWAVVCMVLVLAGCSAASQKTAGEDYVETAYSLLQQADSFAAQVNMELSIEEEESSMQAVVSMCREPLKMKVEYVESDAETVQETELFLEEDADAMNLYTGHDGYWTEKTMTKEAALQEMQIYNTLHNLEMILNTMQDITVTKADAVYILQGVIPKESFYDMEENAEPFRIAGVSGIPEEYLEGMAGVPVTVTLEQKTKQPLSYEMDLTEALKTILQNVLEEIEMEEELITVEKYHISSKLLQLGKVKAEQIELPAQIREKAVNIEREISGMQSKME